MMRSRNIVLCVLAFVGLNAAAVTAGTPEKKTAETQTQYLAVMVDGKKIGHCEMVRKVAGGKVTTSQAMHLTITRGEMSMQVKVVETCTETADGRPISFASVHDMGFMSQNTTGKVNEQGKLVVTVFAMGQTQQRTIAWPKGALMPEGQRLLAMKKGLKKGTTYTLKAFEPSSQTAMDVKMRIGKTAPVDLFGRVVTLTETTGIMQSPVGELTITAWVNEKQDVQRMITPVMGMKIEMVACSKAVALSPNDVVDFFDKLFVASPQPIENVAGAKATTYTLEPKGKKILNILVTDNQKVAAGKGGNVLVTVRPVQPTAKQVLPYKGKDKAALKALKPTRFLQSDDKVVIALAKKAVGDTKDAAQAVRKIEAFVRKYIKKKNLAVGYASAAEVARNPQGDCTEHAVLTAAMCRAVGIPAQVVSGLVYVKKFAGREHFFAPHAWNRAYVGGKWIGLDAALPGRYDAGHIALATGDLGDPTNFFGMINTLGYFKIKAVKIDR